MNRRAILGFYQLHSESSAVALARDTLKDRAQMDRGYYLRISNPTWATQRWQKIFRWLARKTELSLFLARSLTISNERNKQRSAYTPFVRGTRNILVPNDETNHERRLPKMNNLWTVTFLWTLRKLLFKSCTPEDGSGGTQNMNTEKAHRLLGQPKML